MLLVASYVFYGWWDYRFLFLIIFSTIVDFSIGLGLSKENHLKRRKVLLITSVLVNLGLLGFFKYYNFFIDNFVTVFSFFGNEIQVSSLEIILPVGISFYTFQTLSYTIDVYKKKLEPTKDFIAFSVFVSFFPQLVAGPIEKASKLLPQFYKLRVFDYRKGKQGVQQILWGLFKKIVIADSCAPFVNDIFANYSNYSGSVLIIGAVLFAFQIYGDFSGYSDMAIGIAKIFGVDLMTNFKTPYFSKSIPEFWRRWHISLSNWFRDYLYFPLGGSKRKSIIVVRNIFIVFIVSGFWHGANWTFIFWGVLNAVYYLPSFILKSSGLNETMVSTNNFIETINTFLSMTITFALTIFAWIFFRSENISIAFEYISRIFKKANFFNLSYLQLSNQSIKVLLFYLTFFVAIDWFYRNKSHVFIDTNHLIKDKIIKPFFYLITVLGIILSLNNMANSFIYFQF
ncbi:MBOAT family O-acyltransferase [Flavivirga abyssicola]|uniref:MBOAT family O-acyltransferase n=1 Tax=Flavivirga abyssicola TaxID=3063533 RepID=UPI002ED412D1|nr:MBOAT family O-acyltransferase [Flavivirga sp. MEBiC07777]